MEKAKEFEKTGVPWKNVVASVGHKVPEDSTLYEYIHQKGAICTAASMETIDKKYPDGEVNDFKLLKNDYSGFLTIGIDMIQTDLPAFVGSLLYGTVPNHSPKATMRNQLDCDRCIILAEQSQHRIAVVNTTSGDIVWEWKAENSNINPEHLKWFNSPSDAKIVYSGRYMLVSASGGGIALVRIKDKKTVFYAFAGGNTHSIELLPDGNIISASSTGNYLAIFRTDTLNYPTGIFMKKIQIPSGHNIVWDNSRQLLWTAAMDYLIAFKYNFNCTNPDLTRIDSIRIPGTHAHDLFPVYKEDALWLTTADDILKFNISSGKFQKLDCIEGRNIKSVSSGSENFPVIISRPKEEWWTDEVIDKDGNSIFRQKGYKIYKARWLMINTFSYEENSRIHLCN
jgi:hypothetical protein